MGLWPWREMGISCTIQINAVPETHRLGNRMPDFASPQVSFSSGIDLLTWSQSLN